MSAFSCFKSLIIASNGLFAGILDSLLRQQLQNRSSLGGIRSFISQLSIELDISPAEETVQTHRMRRKAVLVLLLDFPACHTRGFHSEDCARQCS
jgi:hypothetical protein